MGNGVFDFEDSAPTHVPFAYGHGFLSHHQYNEIVNSCQGRYAKPNVACKNALARIDRMMVDTNGYDAYRTCYQPSESSSETSYFSQAPWTPSTVIQRATTNGRADASVQKWLQRLHMISQSRPRRHGPVSTGEKVKKEKKKETKKRRKQKES